MNERNRKIRNAGILATAGLAIAMVGGSCANNEVKPTYTPNPTATKLATPSTSEAGASPSLSPIPEVSSSPEASIQTFVVEKLGTLEVQPGDFIAGDISMSNTKDSAVFPLFDQDTHKAADVTDNTKTALYVDVQVPGVIHAEWGAFVTRGLTPEKKAEMLKLETLQKLRAGFSKTDVVLWTGYDTTVDEAGFKADSTSSATPVNPSESPAASTNPTASPEASPATGYNLENISNQEKTRLILNLFAEGKVDPNSAEGKALLDVLANCFCATTCTKPAEIPAPSAMPSATPSATPEAQCTPLTDIYLKSGQKVTVQGPFNVLGDVTMDGVSRHDSSSKTFAVDKVTDTKQHIIIAPWGADVQKFNTCANPQVQTTAYGKAVDDGKSSGRTFDSNSLVEK